MYTILSYACFIQTARMSEGAGEPKGDAEADRLEGQLSRATRH